MKLKAFVSFTLMLTIGELASVHFSAVLTKDKAVRTAIYIKPAT